MGLKTLLKFKAIYEKSGNKTQLAKVMENLKNYKQEELKEIVEPPILKPKEIKKNGNKRPTN